MNIDYSKITDNPKVIELLKQRIEIENKIKAIDETALIKHELELLSLPVVIVSDFCECEGEKEYHFAGGDKCQWCYKPFDNSKNN
jgi:hypothetical protein